MRRINHRCVVPVLGAQETRNARGQTEVWIILPLYVGSLQSVIDKGPGWPRCAFDSSATVLQIMLDVVDGLAAIHAAGFRHGDVKAGNVLLTATNNAVLSDLGSASTLEVKVRSRGAALSLQEQASSLSTASYRSPELHDTPSECTVDGKADVWALGCLMFAACFSRTPFESASGLSTLALLSGNMSLPPRHPWPLEWLRAIESCLCVDCAARLDLAMLQRTLKTLPVVDLAREVVAVAFVPSSAAPVPAPAPAPASASASAPAPAPEADFAHFELPLTRVAASGGKGKSQDELDDGEFGVFVSAAN